MTFYEKTIRRLMQEGRLSADDRVLVVCGGSFDSQVMQAAGLKNVVVTNLDERYDGYCAPYEWIHLDAEAIALDDGSYDWVIEHAGLHHCLSPHKGLLEMLRVARKGVLAIESRDSALMRLAIRLGFTSEYEIDSVALDPKGLGGQRNSGVPNFVYRWTEREVRKTVESAHPDLANEYRYFYGLTLPMQRLTMSSGPRRLAARLLGLGAWVASVLAPGQGNQFGFAIFKNAKDKDWILRDEEGTRLDPAYNLSFDTSRYRRSRKA